MNTDFIKDLRTKKLHDDARRDLNDALDKGDDKTLAAWARTYGRAAIESLRSAPVS